MSSWASFEEALDQRTAEGRTATFWLRDDDATSVTPALERLVNLTQAAKAPAVLAVVAALAEPALADWTRDAPGIRAAVHGFKHANHAPGGEKPQEFGPHRPAESMLAELRTAQARIATLFGKQALPMLVPPWNRIASSLLPMLPPLGFRYLSLFGPIDARKTADLTSVNCHIDIIDWRAGRRCRPHEEMVAEIAGLLRNRSKANGEAIGILTHHLVHDESAWSFLARLFEATADRARWIAPV